MEFLTALDSFHKSNPDRLGPASAQLRRSLGRYVPEALFDRLVAALIADGTINSDGMLELCVCRGSVKAKLSLEKNDKVFLLTKGEFLKS